MAEEKDAEDQGGLQSSRTEDPLRLDVENDTLPLDQRLADMGVEADEYKR